MMHYVSNIQQPEWQDVGGSISFIFLFDLSVANSFIFMKESPNHKLYTKDSVKKPRKLLGFRKNLAKQLIGDYRENRKRPSREPDTPAGEHWHMTTPTKRTCKNCFEQKEPGEQPSTSRVKCSGCSSQRGQANLYINCFKDWHRRKNKQFSTVYSVLFH